MKKVLLLNFDCGSGVEYVGNVIAKWLTELDVDFFEYKIQNPACLIIDKFIEFKPDIVIINDRSPRLYEAAYYYKRFFPETKSIYISHGLKEIDRPQTTNNNEKREDEVLFYIFMRDYIDKVIALRDIDKAQEFIKNRVLAGCFPVDPKEYYSKIKWNERPKNFCYIGQINKLKVSEDFIRLLKINPDIEMDFYGFLNESGFLSIDCVEFMKNNKNYYGVQQQSNIPDILNQYKYFILPHGRMGEIFNITLLQAINCGTIPIVLNDRIVKTFNNSWVDWAKDFITELNKEDELLTTLKNLKNDKHDYTHISDKISKEAGDKFHYNKFKEDFSNLIKGG